VVQYSSRCWTHFFGNTPAPIQIDYKGLSRIEIVRGDWYAVRLIKNETEVASDLVLGFETVEAATLAADAFWQLANSQAAAAVE
jgi:hypothetical protein